MSMDTSILASTLGLGLDLNYMDLSELSRGFGTLMSNALTTTGDSMFNNLLKGLMLTQGLQQDVANSIAGSAVGLAANGIGLGINALGGNSRLSRGIGQGVSTGLGTIGGTAVNNLLSGLKLFSDFTGAKAAGKQAFKTALESGKNLAEAGNAATKALKLAKWNSIGGLGMLIVGSGLSAAFGPSKEYGGTYGNITKTMDSVYDIANSAVNFVPGWGLLASGIMTLNKGLSNVFGSTDGMTKQDAILGSAFMPAPVKWLNMAGAKTTSNFDNQSWQNTEKATDFMGSSFGNLNEKFERARKESGKTYGTFSRGAYKHALRNLDFANPAWLQILAMADQNELQNIRSQYMSSINNQRYAQMIQGAWLPTYRGKQGMKILNNATNHKVGMRLLSGAALIDDKQMILNSYGGEIIKALWGTKLWNSIKNAAQVAAIAENPAVMTAAGWTIDENGQAKQDSFNTPERNQLADNLSMIGEAGLVAPTIVQDVGLLYNTVRHPILTAKTVYNTGKAVASTIQKGFKWAYDKTGLLVKVPIKKLRINNGWQGNRYTLDQTTLSGILNFINNDIIPRIKKLGHNVDSYNPVFRLFSPEVDAFDKAITKTNSNSGAWFSPVSNDITLRGPLEKLDFGLVIHESGGHGLRYSMQPDYLPTKREYLNEYIVTGGKNMSDKAANALLNSHAGDEVFNAEETQKLMESYPWIKQYFERVPRKKPGEILREAGAVNSQFRAHYSNSGKIVGDELDKIIDKVSPGIILRDLIELPYTSSIIDDIAGITGENPDKLLFYSPKMLEELVNKSSKLQKIVSKIKDTMKTVGIYGAPLMIEGSVTSTLNNNNE